MEAIRALLKQITTFWEGKDKKFRRNVIIIAAVVLAAIVISSILLNQVPYAVLYSGLQPQDSTAVLEALREQKVAYRVSGDSILVPAAEADGLRLSLSTEVKNGFNLDILKQGQGLGMTESDKQDYRRYQIQSDIRSSILTLKGVKDARVAVTMPKESVLVIDNNRQDATAGVILTMDSGMELTAGQVKSIALFVQKAVPGLKMDNISIMDSNMQNLDISGSNDLEVSANDRYALQYDVQSKLRKQIMALLQPVFGIGRVEAQVSVALDFDDRTVESVKFEPVVGKTGIVVSIDKLREQIVNGTSAGGEPGTSTNTGTGTTTYPVVNVDNGTYEKNAEKINYEINSIKEHLIEEKGAIKSLSVSVVIDNTGTKDDYTDNVKNLVAGAVGVDKGLISVEYLPMQGAQAFSEALENEAKAASAQAQTAQTTVWIIAGAIALVLIVAMMLLFSARKGGKAPAQAAPVAQQAGYGAVVGPGEEEPVDQLDPIRIVKESGTKEQIGKLIKDNPELVANLLRSWLAEED